METTEHEVVRALLRVAADDEEGTVVLLAHPLLEGKSQAHEAGGGILAAAKRTRTMKLRSSKGSTLFLPVNCTDSVFLSANCKEIKGDEGGNKTEIANWLAHTKFFMAVSATSLMPELRTKRVCLSFSCTFESRFASSRLPFCVLGLLQTEVDVR